MEELDIQDLPPTAKLEAFQAQQMIRGQILQELDRSHKQATQQKQITRKLIIKAKRRARKQQPKRKHR